MRDSLASFIESDHGVEEYLVPIDERVKLFHQALVLLRDSQIEESALANHGSTKAGCRAVLFLTLREGAVVETELLAEPNLFRGKHSNAVEAIVLLDLGDCLAIRIATMTQPGSEVSEKDRIDSQDIVAFRIVEVPLIRDVVKVG